MCERVRVCVCLCAFLCVCVCVCVSECMSERVGGREAESDLFVRARIALTVDLQL